MRTLSATATIAADKPVVDLIRLLKIEFDGLTLYLCDRMFESGGNVFDSNLYEPLVLSWGTCNTGKIDPVTYEVQPGEMEVTIDNSVPIGGSDSFTALFSTYNPHYVKVTYSWIFEGASVTADAVTRLVGTVEDLINMTTDSVGMVISGYELTIANKFPVSYVETDTYAGADPDDIGKMLPVVYGSCKRVPFRALSAGIVTTTTDALTDIAPTDSGTLDVGTDLFAGKTNFTIQIDEEQIDCASASGNTITLAAASSRGANSTTATSHNPGATVAEVLTSYVYGIGHAIKDFDNVYVYDQTKKAWFIPDSGDYTEYTGQTGDQLAGYGSLAVISFNTLPLITKQIGWETEVGTGSHSHTLTTSSSVTRTGTSSADPQSDWTNESNAYDGNESTYAYSNANSSGEYLIIYFSETDLGTVISRRVKLVYSSALPTYQNYGRISCGTATAQYFPGTGSTSTKSTIYRTFSGDSWDLDVKIDHYSNAPAINVYNVEVEVTYGDAAEPNPADGVTVDLSGNSTADTVIGGMVSADVQGYQDDGSGSITGSANALIERPDHICQHILVSQCAAITAFDISYADAATFYAAQSYKLAVCLLQKPNVRSLLNKIAIQSKSLEFWESGKHVLLPIQTETTDLSVDGNMVDQGQVWVHYTDRQSLQNKFTARYDRLWSGYDDQETADRAAVNATDATSVSDYGTLEADQITLEFIPGETQAQAVIDWVKDDRKQPRIILELSGGFWFSYVEKGDILDFTDLITVPTITTGYLLTEADEYITTESSDRLLWESAADPTFNELRDALLRLVTFDSDQFRVIEVNDRSDLAIQIKAVKI